MDVKAFSATSADVASHYARRPKDESPNGKRTRQIKIKADLPKHKQGERFIRGPIPMSWLRLASGCGNRSEAVGLLLWYAAGWQRSNPVKLTRAILAEFGVHPRTAKRCLQRMDEVGLVSVEFHRGRSPLVLIQEPDLQDNDDNRTD